MQGQILFVYIILWICHKFETYSAKSEICQKYAIQIMHWFCWWKTLLIVQFTLDYQPDTVWAKLSAQVLFVWEILAYLWPCSKFTLFLFTRDSSCWRRALSLWSFHSLLLRTFTYHFTRWINHAWKWDSHVKPDIFPGLNLLKVN